MIKRFPFVLALVLGAACASAPRAPADPAAVLSGAWEIHTTVDGEPFEGVFDLTSAGGGEVEGSFHVDSPVTFSGSVDGTLSGDLFVFTARYANNPASGCSGTAEGEGILNADGDRIEGDLVIRECGQRIPGAFVMTR